MAKHFRTLDHTADVGLAARADTLGELFEALAEGMCDLICPRGQVTAAASRKIAVQAEDVEALAVDFLAKVLWTIQTEHFAVAAVRVVNCDLPTGQAGRMSVAAELAGEPYRPDRHELTGEIKAVTYHQLKVAREGAEWVARVFLDL